jgi:hypothetical protein
LIPLAEEGRLITQRQARIKKKYNEHKTYSPLVENSLIRSR